MRIITRYLITQILNRFAVVLAAVVSIYLVVDFFEKSDNIMEAGLPFARVFIFFILNIPFIVAQITPVGLLLSILIVFSLMRKNNEMLAFKSCGIGLMRLLAPVVAIGVCTSVGLYFFSDVVVPLTAQKANQIWLKEIKKKSLVRSKGKDIWIRGYRKITNITYYNPEAETLHGVSVNQFDEAFTLVTKIDAEKGRFEAGQWVLQNLIHQQRNTVSGDFEVTHRNELKQALDFTPHDLKRVAKRPETMRFGELWRYIRKMAHEGYDVSGLRVDLHAKPALAAVCMIMCLFGVGLALAGEQNKGVFFSVALGIGLSFCYWVVYSFCLSLGYGGMLPPLLAAWVPNLLFVMVGGLILAAVKH